MTTSRQQLKKLGAEILKPQASLSDIQLFQDLLKAESLKTGQYITEPADRCLALDFAKNVVDGTYFACNWLVLACKRFIYELSVQDTEYLPYVFDEDLAYKHIKRMDKISIGIVLQPCQHFILANMLGWVDKEGRTRFRESYIHVPRKFGKSTLIASLCCDRVCTREIERNPNIYILSGSLRQSEELGAKVYDFILNSKHLERRLQKKGGRYELKKNPNAYIESISATSKTKEGFSSTFLVLDESHILSSNNWDAVETMRMSSINRKSPQFVSISTAGSDDSLPYKYMIDEYVDDLEAQLPVEKQTPEQIRRFLFLTTVNDLEDTKNVLSWYDVQPNLPIINLNEMISNYLAARSEGGNRFAEFVTKNFNIFSSGTDALTNMTELAKNNHTRDIASYRRAPAIIGCDLGGMKDFCSLALIIPTNSRHLVIEQVSFISRGNYKRLVAKPKYERLKEWVEDGKVRIFEGETVDSAMVQQVLYSWNKSFNVLKVGYDVAYAPILKAILDNLGIGEKGQLVYQTNQNLDLTIKFLIEELKDGKISYNNDEIFDFFFLGAKIRHDAHGRLSVEKKNSESKIDLVDAIITGLKLGVEKQWKNRFDQLREKENASQSPKKRTQRRIKKRR